MFSAKKQNKISTASTTSGSLGSSISTLAMERIVDTLRLEHNQGSTNRNYYCVWRQFNNFVVSLDRKPGKWEDCLTLFIGYLINEGRKSATIKSYMSAIKAVLMHINICLNQDQYLIASLMKACRFVNDHVRMRLPIHKAMMKILLDTTADYFDQQPFLKALYQALFTSAYFGLLRVGELTSGEHPIKACDVQIGTNKNNILFILQTSKTHWTDTAPQMVKIVGTPIRKATKVTDLTICPFQMIILRVGELTSGEHPIKACDVQIGTNKNNILFILQTSKTHWTDTAPQMVKIVGTPIRKVTKVTDLTICPFQIIKNYLAMRRPAHTRTEQFFVFSDGSTVKDYLMRNTLSKILHLAKFNHTVYSTHSFRIGQSCDLLKMGISVETIKKLGQWKSNSVFKYLKA